MPSKTPVRSDFAKAARKTLLGVTLAGAAALGVGGLYHALRNDGTVPIDFSQVKPLNGAAASAHEFPTRPASQADLTAKCQIPGAQGPEKQTHDLNELQQYGGNFTRSMLAYAKGAEIYTCYFNKPAVAGTYEAGAGIARISNADAAPGRMAQDIRATVLGYQAIEGRRGYDSSWDLYSRVMQKLVGDAVARSSEFVAAVEMQANGDSSLVHDREQHHAPGWAEFAYAYAQTHDVNKASSAAVNAMLRSPSFIAEHADGAIDSYWADWSSRRVHRSASVKFTGVASVSLGWLPGGFHLADNVTLPTEQQLLQIQPGLARAFEVLAPANRGSGYARKLGKPDGFHTARQAIARLDTKLTGQFNYPGRKDFAKFSEQCAQADYNAGQVPDAAKTLWQEVQKLRNGGQMGREMIAFADRADIAYCSLSDMPKTLLGQWHDGDGIVRVSTVENPDQTITVAAHETLHGIQRTTGVGGMSDHWGIRDAQMMLLSFEDAAHISQYLVALELRDQGDNGPYNQTLKDGGKSFIVTRDAYDAAKAKGLNHAEVLQAAGAAGWRALFDDWGWTTVYNDSVLKNYIWRVMENVAKAPDGSSYSLDTARKTGFVSDDLNFTATIPALPDYKDRFAGNTHMRQAFDYVNLVHLTRAFGVDDPKVKEERARMTKEGNPYFGLDLSIVNNALSRPENTLGALDAMNCFAGVSKSCTYAGKPFNSDDFKPKPAAPSV